jgi:mono/diheme cytochrome c family protein
MANVRMTFTNDIKEVDTAQKAIMNKGRPNKMVFVVDDRDRHDIHQFAHQRWWNVRTQIADDDADQVVPKNTVLAKL